MNKCLYCHSKKGKRFCKTLNGLICSLCCGLYSGNEIDCNEDCSYYKMVNKNRFEKRNELIIKERFPEVNPDIVGYDILCKTEKHAMIAYSIEKTFQTGYLKNKGLTDNKIIDLLELIYFKYYLNNEEINIPNDEIIRDLLDNYTLFKKKLDREISFEDQWKIIIRLIISVKNFTGGIFGDKSYLNYLKNNLDRGVVNSSYVAEDRRGNIRTKKVRDKHAHDTSQTQ